VAPSEGHLLTVAAADYLCHMPTTHCTQLHTLLLLSLGSLLPLSSHFLTRLTPSPLPAHYQPVHIHVLDAHRPWNLENLFGGERERVWVWGDDGLMEDDEEGAGKKRLGKEREAFEALEVRTLARIGSPAG
jgi:hypothetical protein